MQQFTQRMDEQSENALKSVLGKHVGISFPNAWIDINREGVSASSVSLFLETKLYLVIDTDRAETPTGFDYCLLNAFIADKPFDIEDPETIEHEKPYNVCALLTWDPTIVQKILLYEYSESSELESVKYDAAILFEYRAGKVLFSRHDAWPDRLEINHKAEIIDNILETMVKRKVLK